MSWNQSVNSGPSDEPKTTTKTDSLSDDEWPTGADGIAGTHDANFFHTDSQSAQASAKNRWSVFLPLHYEPGYAYPLLVWLHSDGFNENQADHVMPHISLRNYVATGVRGNRAADAIGHCYDWHSSGAAIEKAHESVIAAVESVTDQYSINRARIVLAGYKSGGTMAMRLAMRDPSRFAGVISLGGRVPQGKSVLGNLESLRNRQIPMLWQWAMENDQFCSENLREDIQTAMMMRAKAEIRQYASDDEMNTVTLADINTWIMNNVVSSATVDSRWESSPVEFSSN